MKRILMVTGALVAAGTVAAISAPGFSGFGEGSIWEELRRGAGRLGHRVGHHVRAADVGSEDAGSSRRSKRKRDQDSRTSEEDKSSSGAAFTDEGDDQPHAGRRGKSGKRHSDTASSDDSGGSAGRNERLGSRLDDTEMADAEDMDEQDTSASEGRAGRRAMAADAPAEDYGDAERGERPRRSSGRKSQRQFQRLDRDGDGAITPREFEAAEQDRIPAASKRFFQRFDGNADGRVTRQEYERGSKRGFAVAEDEDSFAEAGRPPRMRGRDRME